MSRKKLPQTSLDAKASLNPESLAEVYRKILYALSKLGEATTEEIASYLKMDHEKIWKRPNELAKQGLIYRPGTKRLTRKGRNAYTWAITGANLPKTTKTEKSLKGKTISQYSKTIISLVKQEKMF